MEDKEGEVAERSWKGKDFLKDTQDKYETNNNLKKLSGSIWSKNSKITQSKFSNGKRKSIIRRYAIINRYMSLFFFFYYNYITYQCNNG